MRSARRPVLFWARLISVRQSHGLAALPPCLSSLWNQAEEEDAVLPLRDSRGRFGGTSRRRHAASPSVPRGMSPHGARWMASAVDGVGSCRGGGVVASLMYVWRGV